MLDGVVFSCQQIGVNTFYKYIEFQVNSFDSYWEILIILKKISLISMYYVKTRADCSLKQQSAGRHVAPLRHIILIPSKPVFALSP